MPERDELSYEDYLVWETVVKISHVHKRDLLKKVIPLLTKKEQETLFNLVKEELK